MALLPKRLSRASRYSASRPTTSSVSHTTALQGAVRAGRAHFSRRETGPGALRLRLGAGGDYSCHRIRPEDRGRELGGRLQLLDGQPLVAASVPSPTNHGASAGRPVLRSAAASESRDRGVAPQREVTAATERWT